MSTNRRLLLCCIVLALSGFGSTVRADGPTFLGDRSMPGGTVADNVRVDKLSDIDQRYLQRQRDQVRDLAARNLGARLDGSTDDLSVLQRLLDQHVVADNDVETLQAMGVVLGDVIRTRLPVHWVIYQDNKGRSRALRLEKSDHFLFPVTMISRRVTAGIHVDVRAVYNKAITAMKPFIGRHPL